MQVAFTQDKTRITVTAGNASFTATFNSDGHARQASKRLGIPAEWIDEAVVRFCREGSTAAEQTYTPDETDDTPADVFKVRLLSQPVNQATIYDSFVDALKHPGATGEHVIEWKDTGEACCIDFDWHTGTPPADLIDYAYKADPLPSYAWITRSGGLRLVYLKQDTTPADALAAVAAYWLVDRVKPQAMELKNATRFPEGEVTTFDGGIELNSIRGLFEESAFNPEARDAYLEEHGLAIGQRYSHDHCPNDSHRPSQSPEPVQVLEDGIKCYSCPAHGKPGFIPWTRLTGDSVPTELATCVKNLTHWEHAQYVIRPHAPTDFPPGLLNAFYKAALIVTHGPEDKRIASAFRQRDLVRFDGFWGTTRGQRRRDTQVKFTVAGLPAVLGPDGKLDNEKHERFLDNADLTEWGYYPLKRVYGSRISTLLSTPRDGRPRIEIPKGIKPEYLPEASRVSEEAAWGLLETAYPGVNRKLIELLVFCRGHVEYGATNAPMFLFEGVSGSGKTGSPKLAAAICGDACSEITPGENEDRLRSQILDSVHNTGTFISVNEVMKAAKRFRIPPLSYLNFLLQITPDSKSHVLYVGPVSLVDVPVLSITDTEFTEEVLGDAQYGRRIFYCDLGTEYNPWKERSIEAGLTSLFAIRSEENFRRAADSLLSIWIDKYWRLADGDPPFALDEVAGQLGIKYLNSRSQSSDRADTMRALFTQWVKFAGASGAMAKRQAKGFKAFKIDPDKYDIARVWVTLHDEGDPTQWGRANERSWAEVLGRDHPTRLQVKRLYADRENWVQLSFQEQLEGGEVWTAVKSS